jgi:hypothetical protein
MYLLDCLTAYDKRSFHSLDIGGVEKTPVYIPKKKYQMEWKRDICMMNTCRIIGSVNISGSPLSSTLYNKQKMYNCNYKSNVTNLLKRAYTPRTVVALVTRELEGAKCFEQRSKES